MAENFFDVHFDALFGGIIALLTGVTIWVGTLYRRLSKSDMNEHRIATLESRIDKALEKADNDHEKIWIQINKQGQDIAEIKAMIKLMLDNNKKG